MFIIIIIIIISNIARVYLQDVPQEVDKYRSLIPLEHQSADASQVTANWREFIHSKANVFDLSINLFMYFALSELAPPQCCLQSF